MERRQQRLVERWMVCLATGKHPGILGTPEPRRSRLLARAEARRLFHPAASEIGSLDLYLAGDLQHRRSGGNGKRAFRRSSGVCDDELSPAVDRQVRVQTSTGRHPEPRPPEIDCGDVRGGNTPSLASSDAGPTTRRNLLRPLCCFRSRC